MGRTMIDSEQLSPLPREEYVEQAHFFTSLADKMRENTPAQEVLESIREEILATTKLPMAIDFLLAELRHLGTFAPGMRQLAHYFTPFQCYVIAEAEDDHRRFDLRVGLEILAREAKYRASDHVTRQGLFVYQFEALCRNRLGYDVGLAAVAGDPSYNAIWREWILTVRRQIGLVELADMIYVRSQYYHDRQAATEGNSGADRETSTRYDSPIAEEKDQVGANSIESVTPTSDQTQVLFGQPEGRIAWANRRRDPLLLFAALHRHLDYPEVPRTKVADPEERLLPVLARRVEQLEARLRLVEEEQRGGINLEQFYAAKSDRPS